MQRAAVVRDIRQAEIGSEWAAWRRRQRPSLHRPALAHAREPAPAKAELVHRAADERVASQRVGGGCGCNGAVPSDADATAFVLLFGALMGRRGNAYRRAVSCLSGRRRREDGGISTYAEQGPIR